LNNKISIMKNAIFTWIGILGMFLFMASCNMESNGETEANYMENDTDSEKMTAESPEKIEKAVCVLHPTEGNDVTGTVTFTQTDEGVRIEADLEGLSEGKHGFHLHEYGDCTALDATSAGGHFNPTDQPHGAPDDEERHVGDFGNITADADGTASYDRVDTMIELNGENSIIGRAIIVHADEDDLESQPTGAAGARVACGVVGIAK
jgi:Cu-Zn family superoxide dismutase